MSKKIKLVKKVILAVSILISAIVIFFLGGYFIFYYTNIPLPIHKAEQASTFVKSEGKKLMLLKDGEWKEFNVSGVTLEDTLPGGLPVTYDMYMKWFSMIHEMNANTIQANDLMGNEFYRAFHDFNTNNEEPLYLIQRITLSDKVFDNMIDGFSGNLEGLLKEKGYRTINAIHGSIKGIKKSYKWDVSQWTLAFTIGSDWDPDLVLYTNDVSSGRTGYEGKYISTLTSSPAFETILAKVGDHIFSYETNKYGQQRLIGYGNWARTDSLIHDSSWSIGLNENVASVNMELIKTSNNVKSGIFTAYHIEPNYPQFLSFDPKYSKYVDKNGEKNPYQGYLKALKEYHNMPIVVSDFGVPTSRGISNIDEVRGFNQGKINEKEQGKILQKLYKDIMDTEISGGFIGNWSDQWNNTVWNTRDTVDTSRSAYWSDAQTSAQAYGLLAFEPGENQSISYIDGNISEWKDEDIVTEKGGYRLQMMYDEKYIYFHVQLKNNYLKGDVVYIPLDITPKSGTKQDTTNKLSYDREMDFVLAIDGADNSKILVQNYYNNIYPLYAVGVEKENAYIDRPNKDSGQFDLIKQLSRKSMIDENNKIRASVFENSGVLHYGNSDPKGKDYDSLADFIIAENNIEIRIPWGLLNFSDPSKMMIHNDFYNNNGSRFINIQEIYAALVVKKVNEIIQIPSGRLELKCWGNSPKWHTRLKTSYYDVQEIFGEYKLHRENN